MKHLGLLLNQLKWGFEPQKNRWVGPMLQDAVDMKRVGGDREASGTIG